MGCEESKVVKSVFSPPAKLDKMVLSIEPQKVAPSPEERSSTLSSRKSTGMSYQGVQGRLPINMDAADFEDALQEYKECEERIRLIEKDDPLTLYYIKKAHLQSINSVMDMTQEKIKSLEKAVANPDQDEEDEGSGKNLRNVVVDYGSKDIVSKAEQEFLTSVNRLEIAGTELEMLKQEKALVESEVSSFKSICVKLMKLYNTQADITKKLAVGSSSPAETTVYKQLANVETKKIKVSESLQRWKEARTQIIDACRQFATALKKWREIKDDTPERLYDLAEEVRDDLVTSLQSISNARSYIGLFELPYCSFQEMVVLEKALSYIFIDMNTAERRLHADSCYKAFHNRAVALFAWTEMTIKDVIEPELKRVTQELAIASKRVRDVRFRTVQRQFPDVSWKVSEDEANLSEEDVGTSTLTDPESVETYRKMDTKQLASAPTMEEIYGKSSTGKNYRAMFLDNLSPETLSLMSNGDIPKTADGNKKKKASSELHPNGVLVGNKGDTVGLA